MRETIVLNDTGANQHTRLHQATSSNSDMRFFGPDEGLPVPRRRLDKEGGVHVSSNNQTPPTRVKCENPHVNSASDG